MINYFRPLWINPISRVSLSLTVFVLFALSTGCYDLDNPKNEIDEVPGPVGDSSADTSNVVEFETDSGEEIASDAEECPCDADDVCCLAECHGQEATGNPCDDSDPFTVEDICNSDFECEGTYYCDLETCTPPPTGQDRCFDDHKEIDCSYHLIGESGCTENSAYCGQDQEYSALTQTNLGRAFGLEEDGGDEIVTDSYTGLIWERKYQEALTHGAAESHCAFLNTISFNSLNDWRLPSFPELANLLNYGPTNSTLLNGEYNSPMVIYVYDYYFPVLDTDLDNDPGVDHTDIGAFWSDTPYLHTDYEGATHGGTVYWGLDPRNANLEVMVPEPIFHQGEAPRMFVRCVNGASKSVPASHHLRFKTLNPGSPEPVLLDRSTSLVWQGEGHPTDLFWGDDDYRSDDDTFELDALEYCETLSYGGFDDWRLPNINALGSLVAYDIEDGTGSDFSGYSNFPNLPPTTYWSSTTFKNAFNMAWALDFGSFLYNRTIDWKNSDQVPEHKESEARNSVMCVRNY